MQDARLGVERLVEARRGQVHPRRHSDRSPVGAPRIGNLGLRRPDLRHRTPAARHDDPIEAAPGEIAEDREALRLDSLALTRTTVSFTAGSAVLVRPI